VHGSADGGHELQADYPPGPAGLVIGHSLHDNGTFIDRVRVLPVSNQQRLLSDH
jgi:hypothetical protein